MKMKSLAMLAFSALTAASFVVATPALADDADNSMPSQNNAANTDNSNNNSGAGSADANNSSDSSASDEVSPDTATGDDDY